MCTHEKRLGCKVCDFCYFYKISRVSIEGVKKWHLSEFFLDRIHFHEVSG